MIIQTGGGMGTAGVAAGLSKASESYTQQKQQKDLMQFQSDLQLQSHKAMSQLDAELELEAHKRAKLWEIEKMETASRIDFRNEEIKRKEKTDQYDAAIKDINSREQSGQLSPPLADQYRHEAFMHSIDYPISLAQPARETNEYGQLPGYFQLLTPEQQAATAQAQSTQELQQTQPKGTFTPEYKAKILGSLSTGTTAEIYGMPLQTMKTRNEYENYAIRNFGPNWKEIAPEAVDIINARFGTPADKGVPSVSVMQGYLLAYGNNIAAAKQAAKRDGYTVP